MGARPEQQLALSFLAALAAMWARHPGTYKVEESETDLVPALGQMCIKALAADVRDTVPAMDQGRAMIGELRSPNGESSRPTVRDIVNKIVHGIPERVVVTEDDVCLHFVNSEDASIDGRWTELWFSGLELMRELDRLLYKHQHLAPERERRIADFLDQLGPDRFLPTPVAAVQSETPDSLRG